jgi:hypothetical protein
VIDPAVTVALIVAVVGPVVAYITSRRSTSGRVDTSEAKELWRATETFMSYQQREIERLHQALISCLEDKYVKPSG